MDEQNISAEKSSIGPVFVVSGGIGALGEQLVRTTLAQFHDIDVPIKIVGRVHLFNQLERVVDEAIASGGTIVHTLVNPEMRSFLADLTNKKKVTCIDVVGPLLRHLSQMLNQEPKGKPGLYRHLHKTYFKRIEAIEFTIAHDDGVNYYNWGQAEIVILGASRVGKTPISLYLSILGWKVANIPLVSTIAPRQELFQLDKRRVMGLTIEPGQLLRHRKHRQGRLGVKGRSSYINPATVYDEMKFVRQVCRQGGFRTIDVTDKPIETSADQIVGHVTRRLKTE